jgi:hypothetical protein
MEYGTFCSHELVQTAGSSRDMTATSVPIVQNGRWHRGRFHVPTRHSGIPNSIPETFSGLLDPQFRSSVVGGNQHCRVGATPTTPTMIGVGSSGIRPEMGRGEEIWRRELPQ